MQQEKVLNKVFSIEVYYNRVRRHSTIGSMVPMVFENQFEKVAWLCLQNRGKIKNGVYQNQIFFFENLGFIELTSARKISYEDALTFEQIHLDVYKEFGFDIMMVPKGLAVQGRCEFILERVQWRFLTTSKSRSKI